MTKKLTKTYVESLPFLESGQAFYRDPELKGFGLRVGSNSKVYIAENKVNGKTVRVTIGRHGVYTAEQARTQAKEILLTMSKGINPNDVTKEKKVRSITLQQAFEDFLNARKALSPRTIYDYKRIMGTYLANWNKKPVAEISKDMIARRHREIGERSEAQANLTMRFLRALFNFAAGQYEDSQGRSLIAENPVKRLSQTRAWYRVDRRQTVIKPSQLPAWFKAVQTLRESANNEHTTPVGDYLLFVLFTGLRREEAARLEWADVDMENRTFTIRDTKNHEPLTLPITDFVYSILEKRKSTASAPRYVFQGHGTSGHLIEPRKQMQKVIEASGVSFTIHDLRRTYITIAESLDISAYALKRLVNHKMTNDVTAGYIISDVERLRDPMQKIASQLLAHFHQ